MNTITNPRVATEHAQDSTKMHGRPGRSHSHRWTMVACCIPMLAIALLLVVTGVISVGFLLFAVACTLMMAFMMGGMDHGHGGDHKH